MATEVTIPAMIASIATGHILFLSGYLWLNTSKHLPNRILSLLLLCYALRVIKSALLLAFPSLPFAGVLISLGVIGMSAIGPLLLLYVRSLLQENFEFSRSDYWHFLPTALLWPTAFFVSDPVMFQVYQVTVYQILIYGLISFSMFIKNKQNKKEPPVYGWLLEVFIAIAILWVVFLIQLYTGNRILYIAVSMIAASVFYAISLRAALRKDVFYPLMRNKKRKGLHKQLLLSAIEAKLNDEKLHLDPLLNVSKLAAHLKVPAYVLSAAINEESRMSFNEFLNQYRIREATVKLGSKKFNNLSVEAIAYDCGFNSLSAFYNAFKKIHNTTPAKFREVAFPDSEIRKPVLKIG